METLSVEEAVRWLVDTVQLPQYEQAFRENHVDGDMLLDQLVSQGILGDLVESRLHQSRIRAALAKSARRAAAAPPPAGDTAAGDVRGIKLRTGLCQLVQQRMLADARGTASAAVAARGGTLAATIIGAHAASGAARLASIDGALREWHGDWQASRWTAQRELGKGGAHDSCVVVEVCDTRLGAIAIKCVLPTFSRSDSTALYYIKLYSVIRASTAGRVTRLETAVS